jgi:PAS domain S-box-containing protein
MAEPEAIQPIAAFSLDFERDTAVWHDQEMYRILGRPVSAGPVPPGELAEAWLHPDDVAHYDRAIARVLDETASIACTIRVVGAGGLRHLSLHLSRDPASAASRLVVGTAQDVTDRAEAHRVLTENLHHLSETSPAMLWMGDAEGRCVYLNAAQRSFWGVDDIADFDWGATLHPEDIEKLAGPFTAAMATRTPFEVSARYRRADGVYRTLRTQARPRFCPDGTFLGMVGVNDDITDRLEAERALHDSERLKDAIMNAALDAIVTVDHQGRFVAFNTAAERLFGHDRGAVIGEPMAERIIPPGMREAHEHGMNRYLLTGESRVLDKRLELPALKADGTEFPAEIAIVRIPDSDPPVFTAFVRDISERRRAEEHNRMLMGELNHRTKNILSVVQAVARQTARHARADAFAQSFSDRLMGLAASNDLLLRHNWTGVDLEELARAQLTHLGDLIGSRIRLSGPKVTIASTAAQTLGMAIHELSTNSLKHGALSHGEGVVALEWAVGGPGFTMNWTETSPKPALAPKRKGFGHSVIVDMVALALDAEVAVDFGPAGFRWSASAPLNGAISI